MMGKTFVIALLCVVFGFVDPRMCNVGYGQRGLRFQKEILWQRNCKETTYCFEAVTSDIEKIKPFIDFPWVSIHFLIPFLSYFILRIFVLDICFAGPILLSVLRQVLRRFSWHAQRFPSLDRY